MMSKWEYLLIARDKYFVAISWSSTTFIKIFFYSLMLINIDCYFNLAVFLKTKNVLQVQFV